MKISIRYRLQGVEDWSERLFSPQDFFELDLDEVPELEGVPRHNHACEYLQVDPRSLAETQIRIDSQADGECMVISELFWNQGNSRFIERSQWGREPYRELIMFTKTGTDTEIVRLVDDSRVYKLLLHSAVRRNEDGTESETSYFPGTSAT